MVVWGRGRCAYINNHCRRQRRYRSQCKHDMLLFILFSGAPQPPQSETVHSATRHACAARGRGRLSQQPKTKPKATVMAHGPRPNHMTWQMARGPTTRLPGRRPTHLRRGAHILRRLFRPFADQNKGVDAPHVVQFPNRFCRRRRLRLGLSLMLVWCGVVWCGVV